MEMNSLIVYLKQHYKPGHIYIKQHCGLKATVVLFSVGAWTEHPRSDHKQCYCSGTDLQIWEAKKKKKKDMLDRNSHSGRVYTFHKSSIIMGIQ